MVRRVIEIDREKCNGCGACADACQEGAIGMVDGKAVLLRDDYCDGLGNCLPHCPTNAITFVEREAAAFDEKAVAAAQLMKKAASLKGSAPVTRSGCSGSAPLQMGCPGSQADTLHQGTDTAAPMRSAPASRLMQWPVQIKLLPVQAPFYQGARLLIAADCTAFSWAIVRMEVPCCGGLQRAAETALRESGKFLPWQVVTLGRDGTIQE